MTAKKKRPDGTQPTRKSLIDALTTVRKTKAVCYYHHEGYRQLDETVDTVRERVEKNPALVKARSKLDAFIDDVNKRNKEIVDEVSRLTLLIQTRGATPVVCKAVAKFVDKYMAS